VILIATPTRDSVTAGTTGDLIRLCRRHPDARWIAALGIYIAHLRESSASAAVQAGASHVLFIDSDMRVPEDTIDRLVAHDCDIVGANYVQRTMPDWWVSRLCGSTVSSLGKRGLERVDSTGFGVMLIRTDVFRRLPQPWFSTPFDGKTYLGEDVAFCQQATAAGLSVMIDHDLSQHVRHTGAIEYGVEHTRELAVA
jgi:hypothetical protein